MNAILVIAPRWDDLSRTWVFDDAARGLAAEPFVSGVPAMIDSLVADIPTARAGFRLLFSASPFPGAGRTLTRLHADCGGTWYRDDSTDLCGWLCPALFRYFAAAPERIYLRAESLSV